MKVPALLVAISLSVSACATAGLPMATVPSTPSSSLFAPTASFGAGTTSFASALERGPLPVRPPDFDLRGHERDRFRQTPYVPTPTDPPGALATIGASLLLIGLGALYLGGSIKRGGGGGISIGKGRLSGGHASLRFSPSSTGLAVKF